MSIELGMKVVKQIAGEDGAAEVAVVAARAVRGAKRTVNKARQAVAEGDQATRVQGGEPKPKSIANSSATTSPGETPSLRAALAGAVSAFKQGAGTPVAVSPQTDEAIAMVAEKVKGTSLVVVDQARQLASVAGGIAPKPLVVSYRLVSGNASADDVGAAIGLVNRKHRGVAGFAKRFALNRFLKQMADRPDPAVFKVLDHCSNSCEERNAALKRISAAIRDMKVSPEVAGEVLRGFNDSVGTPNWEQRIIALAVLNKHFKTREDAAQVLSQFAPDDESVRLDAFRTLVKEYNGMSADEICAFLVLFKDQRGRARKLVDAKLTEPEKVHQIDALFEPTVKLRDAVEIVKVREGVGRLLGTAGATGRAIFDSFRAGATKK